MMAPDLESQPDDECFSCGEGFPKFECPGSKRECGHHCNCLDYNDNCHWCPAHVNDDGNLVGPDGTIVQYGLDDNAGTTPPQ